jgi:hypothetical protein
MCPTGFGSWRSENLIFLGPRLKNLSSDWWAMSYLSPAGTTY